MKLHSALLSTLVATIALTACQPESGIVKARPNANPESPASATPTPVEETKTPEAAAKTAEEDKILADDPMPVPPPIQAGPANNDQPAPHYDPRKGQSPKHGQTGPSKPAQPAKPQSLSADDVKVDRKKLIETTPAAIKETATNCMIQVYQTNMPLPKEVFEKQKGKPMCMVDYLDVRKLHLMASDLDKGVTVAEPTRLRFYDQMLIKMHPALKAKRKFGTEGRSKLIAQTWTQMLASMKTQHGPCDLEFRGNEMKLDFLAHGPLSRVDQETENPGTRFMMKSEDYDHPSWTLKCPLESEAGSGKIEMKTVKQGKYFYVFLDMYENEKGADSDHPAQMMKYLLSAQ